MPLMYFSFHLCILYQFAASRYMKNGRMIEDNREARAQVQSQRSLKTALFHLLKQLSLSRARYSDLSLFSFPNRIQ